MTHIICIRELNYYWSRYHLRQFDNHVISILGLILIQWARVIFYWNETELQTFSDATLLRHSPREKRLASWQYKLNNMSSWTRLNDPLFPVFREIHCMCLITVKCSVLSLHKRYFFNNQSETMSKNKAAITQIISYAPRCIHTIRAWLCFLAGRLIHQYTSGHLFISAWINFNGCTVLKFGNG